MKLIYKLSPVIIVLIGYFLWNPVGPKYGNFSYKIGNGAFMALIVFLIVMIPSIVVFRKNKSSKSTIISEDLPLDQDLDKSNNNQFGFYDILSKQMFFVGIGFYLLILIVRLIESYI